MDRSTWWFDHVGQTYLYVVGVRQGDARLQGQAMEKLSGGADEWGRLTGIPEAGLLMAEHVAGVKGLTDAAFAGQPSEGFVDTLMENVDRQTALYDSDMGAFPTEEWHGLFTSYVAATGQYILALAAGDAGGFKRSHAEAVASRNRLARLWAGVRRPPPGQAR
jgi:hypothetical protein